MIRGAPFGVRLAVTIALTVLAIWLFWVAHDMYFGTGILADPGGV